jgi:tRNA pseudouridine38-40 synthase
MRYFAELAYRGTHYFGWQRQPQQISVQETLETAISTILRGEIIITGCGRTDTGVHARQYFVHFDFEGQIPESLDHRLNKLLPPDISIKRIFSVTPNAHARYDAYERSYEYVLGFEKDPFSTDLVWQFPYAQKPVLGKMQEAAAILTSYDHFYTFCKSNTDVKTMECQLKRAEWIADVEHNQFVFHITANRFLRGMVRLMVGMCVNVGLDNLSLEDVKEALENQILLKKSLSVPPQGLYLTGIKYPYLKELI